MPNTRFGFAILIAVAIAASDVSPAAGQPAAVTQWGSCQIALMHDGDVFMAGFDGPSTCTLATSTWTLRGNMFSIAGRGAGVIVGVSNNYQVLAANGDWFQLAVDYNYCNGTPDVTYQGNVFGLLGEAIAPGETFAIFAGGGNIGYQYAVTTVGRVFRWAACSGWVYAGALPIGPTPLAGESWGQLKIRYR
jgi:hypothetical protein